MSNNSDDDRAAIESRHFETAAEFLEGLRRTDPYWLSPGSLGGEWIFRGESTDSNTLTPSAWREDILNHQMYKAIEGFDFKERLDRIISDPQKRHMELHSKRDILRRLLVQSTFEHNVVLTFQEMVDELGLPIPGGRLPFSAPFDPLESIGPTKMTVNPMDMFSRFTSDEIRPIVALAQHHRMPTRLLDWTLNPLVAAYFAAEGTNEGDEGNLLVWAANRTELRNCSVEEFLVERSQFGFLRAQQGLFTLTRGANFQYLHSGRWLSMDMYVRQNTLRRLTLPRSQGPALRRLLWAEDISKAHLMPTLDNISEALKDYWQLAFSRSLPEIKKSAENVASDEPTRALGDPERSEIVTDPSSHHS